jgi:hypothetical protein
VSFVAELARGAGETGHEEDGAHCDSVCLVLLYPSGNAIRHPCF